jgi:hypothetical protein
VPDGGLRVDNRSPFSTAWHTFIEFMPCHGFFLYKNNIYKKKQKQKQKG